MPSRGRAGRGVVALYGVRRVRGYSHTGEWRGAFLGVFLCVWRGAAGVRVYGRG